MNRILVLLHEYEHYRRGLLIHALSKAWRKRGLQVSFAYGLKERPEAVLLIPQINLTHTPQQYITYINSYANVVNRDVIDISKRRISANLLCKDDDYEGPVIVKTDNNWGGHGEYYLSTIPNLFISMAMHLFILAAESFCRKHLSWRKKLYRFPIYDSLSDVPPGVFENRALVVEKFLPEKEGNWYFLRLYRFLGDHMRSVRIAGPTPFLKASKCVLVDEDIPVPSQVVNLRHQLGMDYGRIDYLVVGNQVVILDANRTPGTPGNSSRTAIEVGALADGIWSLMPNR